MAIHKSLLKKLISFLAKYALTLMMMIQPLMQKELLTQTLSIIETALLITISLSITA